MKQHLNAIKTLDAVSGREERKVVTQMKENTKMLNNEMYFGGLTCSLKARMDVYSIRSLFFRIQSGSSGISTAKTTLTKISTCCEHTQR